MNAVFADGTLTITAEPRIDSYTADGWEKTVLSQIREHSPVRVWDALVEGYFAHLPAEKLPEVRRMLKYFGCLRCLIMVAKHAHIEYDSAMELVNRQRKDLMPFVEEAAALFALADSYFPA